MNFKVNLREINPRLQIKPLHPVGADFKSRLLNFTQIKKHKCKTCHPDEGQDPVVKNRPWNKFRATSDHKNVWNIFELRSRSGGWKAGSLKSYEVSQREEVRVWIPDGRSYMDVLQHQSIFKIVLQ